MSDLASEVATLREAVARLSEKKEVRRRGVPKALKDRLWDTTFGDEAGSGQCYVCGVRICIRNFEAGHVVAVARGGRTILENLRCICRTCNRSMGVQDLDEFKAEFFPIQNMPPVGVIEPCWLCQKEVVFELVSMKCYFDKCSSKVFGQAHCRIVVHRKCSDAYLTCIARHYGTNVLEARTTDCPSCLEDRFRVRSIFNRLTCD